MRGAAVVCVLAALVAACAGERRDGAEKLSVQVSGEPEETAVYELIVKSFERASPHTDIDLIQIGSKDDHLAKLVTAFAAGAAPDVFLVNYREYAQFVARGATAPVGPMLDKRRVDLDAYFPQPLEAFSLQGVLQCMPQNISSLVVYYNKALLRSAGERKPPDRWTWQEFRETAVRLTSGEVRGLGIEPSIVRIAPFVWSNGGEVVDDRERPARFTLEQPGGRGALEFIVSLVRSDMVVPTEKEVAAQDLQTRFVTGKLAMYLASRRDTPAFREVKGLDWDVAPLPAAALPAGILHSDGYCISSRSSQSEAAADFVRFATGPQGQTLTALSGRTVPSLRSVAEGAFLDPTQPPSRSKVFLDAIPHIRRTPVIETWPEIEDEAARILHRGFYDPGFGIDDTLRELDARTSRLFAEARRP